MSRRRRAALTIERKLIEELRERRSKIRAGGGSEKLAARRGKGLMNARERIEVFCQPHTFQESGSHAHHGAQHFGMAKKVMPGDGVVVGTGYVDGRLVAMISQDFTVAAGTLGKVHAMKIVEVMRLAKKLGIPLIAVNHVHAHVYA